eukprot:jgi/Chlat1/8573/Chrsp82S07963
MAGFAIRQLPLSSHRTRLRLDEQQHVRQPSHALARRAACCALTSDSASASLSSRESSTSTVDAASLCTCRRCRQQYNSQTNGPQACRYHTELFTGGEATKYLGIEAGMGEKGLRRFWDCCGATSEDVVGCATGRHLAYGEEES